MRKFLNHLLSLSIILASIHFVAAQPNSGDGITVTTSAYYLADAALDEGGDWSTSSFGLKVGRNWNNGEGGSFGMGFQYEYHDHSFSGVDSPWDSVQVAGVSGIWTRQLDENWSLYVSPSIELSREDGGDTGDAFEFGSIVAFNRFYSRDLQVGYGFGLFTGLEDTTAYPILLIRWQINESWYLGNPFTPGPVGPAGLEIGYRSGENWSIAFGSAYRSNRFKLDDDGEVPGGFGETEAIALFIRSSHDFQNGSELHLYAGTLVGGELSLEDEGGRTVAESDFDPSLLIAIAWQGRF